MTHTSRQRFEGGAVFWFAVGLAVFAVASCQGQTTGLETATTCTVNEESSGAVTIECPDGTSATLEPGEDGIGCWSNVEADGSVTITCGDGSSATIPAPEDGEGCTVTENPDGSVTITCGDGTTATLQPGEDAEPCTHVVNANGTSTVTCPDGTNVTWFTGHPRATIAAGRAHTCGLRTDGRIRCWGSDAFGQSPKPGALFWKLATGARHTWAIRIDGVLLQWGEGTAEHVDVYDGPYVRVATGPEALHGCAIRASDSGIDCWGDDTHGQTSDAPTTGTWIALAVGKHHTCALGEAGNVTCWGAGATVDVCDGVTDVSCGQGTPPPGIAFTTLTAGSLHTCGLDDTGEIHCWGLGDTPGGSCTTPLFDCGQATPPSGTFAAVAAGAYHTCALDADGIAACWGLGETGGACDCASDELDCGQASPPDQALVQLSAGLVHTCAMTALHDAVCWGVGDIVDPDAACFAQGQSAVPDVFP